MFLAREVYWPVGNLRHLALWLLEPHLVLWLLETRLHRCVAGRLHMIKVLGVRAILRGLWLFSGATKSIIVFDVKVPSLHAAFGGF